MSERQLAPLYIDLIVNSTMGNRMLSFMNAYFSYIQTLVNQSNQEKTSFINDQRLCCYKVMLFRLKNVGATYQ